MPLTELAQDIADNLPVVVQDDPMTQAYCEGTGQELQRLWDAGNTIRRGFVPTLADDTYGQLSALERLMGLPVAPAGQTVAQRQQSVTSRFRSRNDGSLLATAARITTALRSDAWTFKIGPAPNTITFTLPFPSGTYPAEVGLALIERDLPAHLSVTVQNSEAFLVGLSRIGFSPIGQPS